MSALLGTKTGGVVDGQQIFDGSHVLSLDGGARKYYFPNGTTAAIDLSDPLKIRFWNGALDIVTNGIDVLSVVTEIDANGSSVANIGAGGWTWLSDNGLTYFDNNGFHGSGAGLIGVSASTVTGVTDGSSAAAGKVGEYIPASRVVGSATALTTATPKTVTSISLTAGDWDVTAIGAITGASTGTEFDVAISTTTNSMTGTVLGDTRAQTPTVSLAGADATLMIPAVRVSISSTTTYYLIVQETFTVGSPAAYGRISARRVR